MIWRSVQSPAQHLRRMIIQKAQEWTPTQTGIRTRDQKLSEPGDTHATSGNSGKGPGQRGVPGSGQ